MFRLQASVDICLHVSCTSPEQVCVFVKRHVGVDNEENTTTFQQTAAREEFARTSKERRQQRMAE